MTGARWILTSGGVENPAPAVPTRALPTSGSVVRENARASILLGVLALIWFALASRTWFGDELGPAVDQTCLLGAVLQGAAGNRLVVRLVGLTEVRRVGVRDGPPGAHPVERGAGVETAGKGDADVLARGQVLKNGCHGVDGGCGPLVAPGRNRPNSLQLRPL